ncbi:MAG TPA: ATP-binding protein [Selenomonadales bacterium]|nr:ATP-binding protein [Selenomonadales bacterium]
MPKRIQVSLASEHLSLMKKHSPLNALVELIWNGLDADATRIDISITESPLLGIDEVTVTDNGHGIDFATVEESFGRYGGSQKILQRQSPSGRIVHGHKGYGRYRALSLGALVTWISRYRDGIITKEYEISTEYSNAAQFDISDPAPVTNAQTGVAVRIRSIHERASAILGNRESLRIELTKTFAPYLLIYPSVEIIVNGIALQPRKMIDLDKIIRFNFQAEKQEYSANMTVVRWKQLDAKELWLCSSEGAPYKLIDLRVNMSPFAVSAYISSEYIEKALREYTLDLEELDPSIGALLAEAREQLRGLYREWASNRAAIAVSRLKAEGVYPYVGEPKTRMDEAERQVFDICVLKISEAKPEVFEAKAQSKKLTLSLLKEALRDNPNDLRRVLQEVLDLKDSELRDLIEVLEKTSLRNMISTAKTVGDRLKFLAGLDQLVYDPATNKHVLERSQLHKILLNELWILGDQYLYGADDVRLSNVLKEYAKYLGREELAIDLSIEEIQSMSDIPDICLWHQYSSGTPGHVENLIIELKRPSVDIGLKELNQIAEYSRVVSESPRFPKQKTKWTFIIIGRKIEDGVRFALHSDDELKDWYIKKDGVRVIVREWGEVIHEAKSRLKFLEDQLMNSATSEDGLNYLRAKYNDLLPKELRDEVAATSQCESQGSF